MAEQENNNNTIEVKQSVALVANRGFSPTTLEQAYRLAKALAESDLVPERYRRKPNDCFVALDIAERLRSHWLAVMQSLYVVKGTPAFDAKFIVAQINQSGLYTNPLDYEIKGGDDAFNKDYQVRAFATSASTGKTLFGPWITWKIIKGEGWDSKPGSKWLTMPEQMFHYRAASWFKNRHCPQVTMGMMSMDEAYDMPEVKQVESFDVALENAKVKIENEAGSETVEIAQNEEKSAKVQAKVDEQKEKLKQAEKPAANKVEQPKKYRCIKGHFFDEPKASGKGGKTKICPECFSAKIEENTPETEGEKPGFMND